MVMSILLVIVGAIAYPTLAISEYPEVVPPTIVITTQYPGASAQVIADTVATPIEQEVNGVEDMLYIYSQATVDGQLTITVTFKLGTDLDKAQVLVQNRVAIAVPGCRTRSSGSAYRPRSSRPISCWSSSCISPDETYDQLYISQLRLAPGPRRTSPDQGRRRHHDLRRARLLRCGSGSIRTGWPSSA